MADTDVEVFVRAFTEAAEESLEDVGDQMVQMSAEAQPAQAATDDLADKLNKLTVSAGAANVSIRGLSLALVGSFIPALVALSSVLLPLTAAVAGLLAPVASLGVLLGGLAATGAVTHMSELKQAFATAREEIMRIIEPLGEVFGPLLVDAVQALPDLVQAIVDSLGPVQQFADFLRELGGIAMEVIPAITGAMADLARDAIPNMNSAFESARSIVPAVMDAIQRATEALVPLLRELGGALADFLPDFFDFGMIAAQMVLPALTALIQALDMAVEAVMGLPPNLRRLTVAASLTAPAIYAVATAIGALTGPIGLAVAAVAALVAAYRADFLGMQDAVNEAISAITDALGGLIDAFRPTFQAMRSLVTENQGALRRFARVGRNALRGIVQFVRGTVLPAFRFVFQNFIVPLVNGLAQTFAGRFGSIVRTLSDFVSDVTAAFRVVGQFLAGFWDQYGSRLTAGFRLGLDMLVGIARTTLDAVLTTFQVFIELLTLDFDDAFTHIANFFRRTFQGMVEFLRQRPGLVQAMRDLSNDITAFFTETIPQAVVVGLGIAIGTTQNLLDRLANVFIAAFNGIITAVQQAMESFVNAIIEGLNTAIRTIRGLVESLPKEVKEGLSFGAEDIQTLEQRDLTTGAPLERQETGDAQAQRTAAVRNLAVQLGIQTEGDNLLARYIEENASATVDEQQESNQRQARRLGGRGVGP